MEEPWRQLNRDVILYVIPDTLTRSWKGATNLRRQL